MSEALFHYDFNSPYAYVAAHRIDDLLPASATWSPIAFGALIGQIGKVPWSLQPGREAGMHECEARVAALGLPLVWPEGWPDANYSIAVLRAALVAEEHGRLKTFSLAVYAEGLGAGRDLRDPAVLDDVARAADLDPVAIRARMADPEIKDRLRERTDEAIAAGVTGIPTVRVGDECFWGDDRLEDAAARLRSR